MNNINSNPAIREGDTIMTEWSKISYERWCADNQVEYQAVPGTRIVNLYEVVDSIIENDLTEAEQTAAKLYYFEGFSIKRIARILGTSYSNAHAAIKRAEKKLKLVLKHLIDCEEYKIETDEI